MTVAASVGLAAQLTELGRRFHRHMYDFLTPLVEFDRSGEWAFTGARLRHRVEPDGMQTITLRLPPAAAGATLAAIDQHTRRSRRGRYDTTTKYFGALSNDWPSLARQRAHALVDLLTNGAGSVTTELVIHIHGDGCTLDDGTPIDDHAVTRLLDTAYIRALIYDAQRRPVNASTRRRSPTVRQQRVVKARQPHCVDCGTTQLIQYDHNPDYDITRHTHTDELEPRCTPCHTARHRDTPPSANTRRE